MPTRYLKPGIRDSERIESISFPDAEILYYRLIVSVDDFGRTDARPLMLKSLCFPIRLRATADKCMQWLQDLVNAGLVVVYEVEGKSYLQIVKWDNKPRAERSKYPDPPTDVYSCPQMLPVTVNREPEPKPKQKGNGSAQAPFILPDWIPEEPWNAWLESRTKARKAPTAYAKRLAVLKLDNYRAEGHAPAQVLMQSAFNGWSGLFPPKEIK